MAAGRPPKYNTPEEMQLVIDEYFSEKMVATEKGIVFKHYTMSGLARALGMSRRALVDYAHKDEFLPTIKAARQTVEEALEESLYGQGVTGVIFNLKNNFGWKDQKDIAGTLNVRDASELSDSDLEAIATGRRKGAAE